MTRRKPKKTIDITGRKIGSSDEFEGADDQGECVEHIISGKTLKYPPTMNPTEPGFYWLAEDGMPVHLVQLCIEPDSHSMYYVLLPGDDYKYEQEIWPGALWFGPLDEEDAKAAQRSGEQ